MRLIDADALVAELKWLQSQVSSTSAMEIAEYIDRINAQPTVDAVVLPCKPMDTVYFIECRTDGNHRIRSGFALSVEYFVCYKPLVTIRYNDNTLESTKHYLGLKASMTREEAEAAIAKMKGGEGHDRPGKAD